MLSGPFGMAMVCVLGKPLKTTGTDKEDDDQRAGGVRSAVLIRHIEAVPDGRIVLSHCRHTSSFRVRADR